MPTEAQINANRLNSQKSTGPTSPEGKARSSLNALKSGIDAWSVIIPGEDPEELEALTAAFLLHHHPAGPNQLALVDTLIFAEWTQRRLRRIEAQLWNHQVECLDKNLTRAEFQDPSYRHNSPLAQCYQAALDPFTRIQRRMDATNRMYLRTLKVLQDLQAAAPPEQANEPAPQPVEPASNPATPFPESASPVATQPLTPPIGFVPANARGAGPRPAKTTRGPACTPRKSQYPATKNGLGARSHFAYTPEHANNRRGRTWQAPGKG
jgi:hypothetical protein